MGLNSFKVAHFYFSNSSHPFPLLHYVANQNVKMTFVFCCTFMLESLKQHDPLLIVGHGVKVQ